MTTDPHHISLAEFDIEHAVLGSGAYSEIISATHRRDNTPYALKIVNKEKAQRHNNVKYFLNERRVMLMCQHDRIIKLNWTTKDEQHIYFIYEMAPNGELWETLRGFPKFTPPPLIRRIWISQLISAIEYIHMNHKIAHRDLKPENILLDDNFNLKLCDFGTSKIMTKTTLDNEYSLYLRALAEATQRIDQQHAMRAASGQAMGGLTGPDVLSNNEDRRRSILYQAGRTQSFTGTPHYMAPEVIKTLGTRGTAADLWALGVIIFQMETGELPFQHDSPYAVLNEVVEMNCDLDLVEDEDAKDLIRQLFIRNPKKRLGVVGDDGLRYKPIKSDSTIINGDSNDNIGVDSTNGDDDNNNNNNNRKDQNDDVDGDDNNNIVDIITPSAAQIDGNTNTTPTTTNNNNNKKNGENGNNNDDDEDDEIVVKKSTTRKKTTNVQGWDVNDDGDEDNYHDEIDPLTKRRKPKLLSDTTVYTTQLGWDAIKAHPYFTKVFGKINLDGKNDEKNNDEKNNDEKNDTKNNNDDTNIYWNCDLPQELQDQVAKARELCYNFIKFYDEKGNEVLHPKQQAQIDRKKQEEAEIENITKQLDEAFPSIDGKITIIDNYEHIGSEDDDDDNDNDNDENQE